MKLGVDFGTTRIVAAAADRGNYPLVSFEAPDGQTRDWFPPLVAVRGSERLFGWDAWAVQGDPEWTVLQSLKRALKDSGRDGPLRELLVDLLTAFRVSLGMDEPLEVMLGVPANANSNQRFLTVDSFREAGFQVLGMLNEPSAASVEFGHRERAARKKLLVYDLGGGTFDASLVEMEADTHTVVATAGVPGPGRRRF